MTPGNFEVVEIVVSWAVTLPAVAAVIVADERRLRGEELARAWTPPSRDAAIFAMWILASVHPICLPVHFVRTRRSLRGVALGVLWLAAVVAADAGAQLGAAALADWLGAS